MEIPWLPLIAAGSPLVAATFAGFLVSFQARAVGVAEPEEGVSWPRLLGVVAFWMTLIGGGAVVGRMLGAEAVAEMLGRLFVVLLPTAPGAILLAGAATWAQGRLAEEDGQSAGARATARWAMAGAGVLAALLVVQTDLLPLLLVIAAGGAGIYLFVRPEARRQILDVWEQYRAGVALDDLLRPDTLLRRGKQEILPVGPIGLLSTEVLVDGQPQVLPNRELLVLAQGPKA
ncbi:MAG: hypothetical protein H6738_14565 [Alphaproteobacteria bacterium]|nr:hypothetical protein [Alphaproteobacteria bacterium]